MVCTDELRPLVNAAPNGVLTLPFYRNGSPIKDPFLFHPTALAQKTNMKGEKNVKTELQYAKELIISPPRKGIPSGMKNIFI